MKKMKLIIEVDQKYYEACKDAVEESYPSQIEEVIANGIPYNPSGDLISREALKRKAYTAVILEPDEKGIDYVKDKRYVVDLEDIDNAPTVELERPQSNQIAWEQGYEAGLAQGKQERPQGEWVLLETDCDDGGNNRYECSECHYSDIHSGSVEVPYCWHRGAKMKGGAE